MFYVLFVGSHVEIKSKYKKRRQLSTRYQMTQKLTTHDRPPYGLQQWGKPIPHTYSLIYSLLTWDRHIQNVLRKLVEIKKNNTLLFWLFVLLSSSFLRGILPIHSNLETNWTYSDATSHFFSHPNAIGKFG